MKKIKHILLRLLAILEEENKEFEHPCAQGFLQNYRKNIASFKEKKKLL